MRTVAIGRRALACAVVSAVLLTGCGKDGNNDEQAAPSTVTSTVTGGGGGQSSIEDRAGGASVDGDRRSWTDPYLRLDDAQHAVPGRYSTELYGTRPVWTPVDPLGDLPAKGDLKDGMEKCSDPNVTLAGKTQIQYVKARYLVVNSQAGPTTMKDGVPGGYAHSVDGAVVAALNQLGYGFPDRSDEVGDNVVDALWSTSASTMRDNPKREGWPSEPYMRPRLVLPMHFFRIASCTDDAVVVQVGLDGTDDEPGVGAEIPLFWRDGDWHADFTGTADQRYNNTPDPEHWPDKQEVRYS